jgi:hypothetical protein
MRCELVASIDAAGPANTIRIEANLICLGSIYPFETDLRRANGERVAVTILGTPDRSAACAIEAVNQATNAIATVFIVRWPAIVNFYRSSFGFHSRASFCASAICAGVMRRAAMSRFSAVGCTPCAAAKLSHMCART